MYASQLQSSGCNQSLHPKRAIEGILSDVEGPEGGAGLFAAGVDEGATVGAVEGLLIVGVAGEEGEGAEAGEGFCTTMA